MEENNNRKNRHISSNNINEAKSILGKKEFERNAKEIYNCEFLKFITFLGATEEAQYGIVEGINKVEGLPEYIKHKMAGWYSSPKKAIKKLISENSSTPIYNELSKVKSKIVKEDDKDGFRNKIYSIKVLQNLLKIYPRLDLELRDLKKVIVDPEKKVFEFLNLRFIFSSKKLTVFKAEYNGQKIVGAVIFNCVQKHFTITQRMAAAYLLKLYLEKEVVKEGEIVLPQFCICIDGFGTGFSISPSGTNEGFFNKVIKKKSEEFYLKYKAVYS